MKVLAVLMLLVAVSAAAQPAPPLAATDLTALDIQSFIKQLPRGTISDSPIRVVDVGGYKVGAFGVFRPKSTVQDAVLHETRITEVYYMLDGAGTLVTGGRLIDPIGAPSGGSITTRRAKRIEGGVSRRVTKGDVIIIPAGTPHWWSELESDISYLIVRPDPEGTLSLK